jgi:hypothetical protein
MRNLASIQRVLEIKSIPNADKIVLATILGWHVVVLKEDVKKGDLVVFFEVDSLLPVHPAFEFLAKGGTKTIISEDKKEHIGYRLRTIKLKGQISQGLCVKPEVFGILKSKVGDDVTDQIGVVKYEHFVESTNQSSTRKPVVLPDWLPVPLGMWIKRTFPQFAVKVWGKNLKPFPCYIPKTDETRLQSAPKVLSRHKKEIFYATEKLDGSSCTVFCKGGEVGVCSRNIWYPKDDGNQFWKAVISLGLDKSIKDYGDIALQGELIGEGIQKNRLKQKGQKIYFFNAYDIKLGQYLSYREFICLCGNLNIPTVPILDDKFKLKSKVDKMVEYATRKSTMNPDVLAEGVVFRPLTESSDPQLGRLSFKVINPDYLLEHGE